MTHTEFLSSLIRSVRAVGAAATLDELRAARPDLVDGAYHDTLATFFVWAVDRLVVGGLSDLGILWHPLTDSRSPLSWWPADRLAQADAFASFVPSTLAHAGEPQPAVAALLAPAA